MPDESRIHAAVAIKLLLERKDHQRLVDVLAQELHPPLPPRPELRADVIDHRNAALAHLTGHAPVERGRVDHDRNIGPPLVRGANQFLVETEDFRKMAEDLGDADNGKVLRIDNDLATGGTHALAARPEKAYRGGGVSPEGVRTKFGGETDFSSPRPQRLNQLGAVHLARRFAR